MAENTTHVEFGGRLLMVGFGCIGRGVLPLLLRHIAIRRGHFRIVTDQDTHRDIAEVHGIGMRVEALTRDNTGASSPRSSARATSCSTCRSTSPASN